jgi:hypothetical protein
MPGMPFYSEWHAIMQHIQVETLLLHLNLHSLQSAQQFPPKKTKKKENGISMDLFQVCHGMAPGHGTCHFRGACHVMAPAIFVAPAMASLASAMDVTHPIQSIVG